MTAFVRVLRRLLRPRGLLAEADGEAAEAALEGACVLVDWAGVLDAAEADTVCVLAAVVPAWVPLTAPFSGGARFLIKRW